MQKCKAYLETALQFLFNKTWLKPEEAGEALAECAAEASRDIFATNSTEEIDKKNTEKARINWLRRFANAFNFRIKKILSNKYTE
jgi:hypothetical protein